MEKEFDFGAFEQTRTYASEEKNEKPNKNKKNGKIIKITAAIIFACIIIISVILIYPMLSAKHNPNKFAEKYISSIVEADWEYVYNHSSFGSSPFISYEAFETYCRENPQGISLGTAPILDYQIEIDKTEDNSIYYSVSYLTEDKTEGTYYINIIKTKDNFWKYDTFTAVPTENSICSATIYAPLGTTITLNGTKLESNSTVTSKSTQENKETAFSAFETGYLFEGSYELAAENPFCNSYSGTIEISRANNKHYLELSVSESCRNELFEKAKSSIETLYNGACANSIDTSELGLSSAFTEEKFLEVLKVAEASVLYTNDSVSVSDFSITDAKQKSDSGTETIIACNYDSVIETAISFDYKYTVTNKIDNASEERKDTGYAVVRFVYENSKWLIDDIAVRAYF